MNEQNQDITRVAEMDRLISRGNVFRMRGEYLAAEDAFREALALDESRNDLRELIADMLYSRGNIDDAAAEYKKLLETKPVAVGVETKYAKTVLEIGEREHQKQIAKELLENPGRASAGEPKQPIYAVILSALAPGVGQLYIGEINKGAILLGSAIFSMVVLAIDWVDVENLLNQLKAMSHPGFRPPPVSPLALLFCGILVFTWIYSVIDAPISADKLRKRQQAAVETQAKSVQS